MTDMGCKSLHSWSPARSHNFIICSMWFQPLPVISLSVLDPRLGNMGTVLYKYLYLYIVRYASCSHISRCSWWRHFSQLHRVRIGQELSVASTSRLWCKISSRHHVCGVMFESLWHVVPEKGVAMWLLTLKVYIASWAHSQIHTAAGRHNPKMPRILYRCLDDSANGPADAMQT